MIRVHEVRLPAVVAAHEHDGTLIDPQLLQQVENLADLPVDHLDHRRVDLRILRPPLVAGIPFEVLVFLPGGFVLGNAPQSMRRRPRQVGEEGTVPVGADELQPLPVDEVVGEHFPALPIADVALQGNLFTVSQQVSRVVAMGVHLVVIAEEDVEPVLLRNPGGPGVAQPPLIQHDVNDVGFLDRLRSRRPVAGEDCEQTKTETKSRPPADVANFRLHQC